MNQASQLTRIRFTDEERIAGNCPDAKLRNAVGAFIQSGVVILENIFSEDLINQMRDEYYRRYAGYFKEDLYEDALPVGNKRMMIQVEIDGVFNNPLIYCHPFLAKILLALLGRVFIIGGFGSVVSLPGAGDQHIHRDSPPLFEGLEGKLQTPPFAITVSIPLIPLTHETGSTRFYPGSHRVGREQAATMSFIDPEVPAGSLVMWDYMTFHGGLKNSSDLVRPILYIAYTKHWFRDPNYSHHGSINMSQDNYEAVPDGLRPLFTWSRPPMKHETKARDPESPCPCFSGKKYKECHGKQ